MVSYHDQLFNLGQQLDSQITAITGAPSTTHSNEGSAVGARWDTDLSNARPPTPLTLYGISAGNNAVASINLVHAQRMRSYNQSQLSAGKAAGVDEFFHSEKLDQTKLIAKDPVYIASVKALYVNVPRGRVAFNHERDNDTAFSLSDTNSANYKDSRQYQLAWLVFLNIIADINYARGWAAKLLTCPTTTGALYQNGNPNWWFVPGADEVGTDIYDPHNFSRAEQFAVSKGKPWSIPETGYSANATLMATDDVMLTRMKGDNVIYTNFSSPPRCVLQFNNRASEITNRPKCAAYWSTLCAKG